MPVVILGAMRISTASVAPSRGRLASGAARPTVASSGQLGPGGDDLGARVRSAGSRAGAPWPGGCRGAAGGTPDPCHRDHPARPGDLVGAPAAASRPLGRPSRRRRRARRTDLDAGAVCGRVVSPPGEGIGRTRPGAGPRPRRGRFRPPSRPRQAIPKRNCEQPPAPIHERFSAPRDLPRMGPPWDHPDPSPDGSPNPSPDGSPWGWGTWGSRLRPVCAGQTLRGAGSRAKTARDPAPLRYVGVPPASPLGRGSDTARPSVGCNRVTSSQRGGSSWAARFMRLRRHSHISTNA